MKVLVTGRSGSGKSTICREIKARGLIAFDGDKVPGLCSWRSPKTGELVAVDYDQPIHRDQAEWSWSRPALERLLADRPDVFLCGSSDNQLEFHGLFDKVFVLTLPPKIQRQRILNRTEHNYGKQPGMVEYILAEQQEFERRAVARGAVTINAERDASVITNDILRLVNAR